MDFFQTVFGVGSHLTAYQMSARAIVMFFVTIVCIHVGGRRAFGKNSPFDSVVVIVLGSIIARGIAGASSFGATVASSFVLALLHRFLSWVMIHSKGLEKLIKGEHMLLFKDDHTIEDNLKKAGMTPDDMYESLRLETKQDSLQKVKAAYMENNGRISFILKEKEAN